MTTTDGPEKALIGIFFKELDQIAEHEIINIAPSAECKASFSEAGATISVSNVKMIDKYYDSFIVWLLKEPESKRIKVAFQPYNTKNPNVRSAIQQNMLKIDWTSNEKSLLKARFRNEFKEELKIFAIREIELPKRFSRNVFSPSELRQFMQNLAISAHEIIKRKFGNTKIDIKFRDDLKTVQVNAVPVSMMNDLGALNILIIIGEKYSNITMFFTFLSKNNDIKKKKFGMDLEPDVEETENNFKTIFRMALHEFTKI